VIPDCVQGMMELYKDLAILIVRIIQMSIYCENLETYLQIRLF